MIILDIETIPKSDFESLKYMRSQITAPSNYKDHEKISAYIKEKEIDMLNKAALSPLLGIVACASLVKDGQIISITGSEKTIIDTILTEAKPLHNQLAGYNLKKFDLPFLQVRAMMLGYSVGEINLLGIASKQCFDPMDFTKNFDGMKQDNLHFAKTGYERKYPFVDYSTYCMEHEEKEYIDYLVKHNCEDVWMFAQIIGVECEDPNE